MDVRIYTSVRQLLQHKTKNRNQRTRKDAHTPFSKVVRSRATLHGEVMVT